MRIHILSDIHLEFAPYERVCPDCDVVIVAGDLRHKQQGADWMRTYAGDRDVIFVPGNHDHWKDRRIPDTTTKMRQRCAAEGIHLLSRDAVVLNGVRFLGVTLWTDLNLRGCEPIDRIAVGLGMNDFKFIKTTPGYRRFRVEHAAALHVGDRSWLEQELAEPHSGPTVVVTHHAPSPRSLRDPSAPKALDSAYASRLDGLVEMSGARFWIHGHTHYPIEYAIGETAVINNGRGYADQNEGLFRPDLVVEV